MMKLLMKSLIKKGIFLFIGLSLLLFLLTACVEKKTETISQPAAESQGKVEEKIINQKIIEEKRGAEKIVEEKINFEITAEHEPEKVLDPKIARLIAKSKESNNMQFLYEEGISNNYQTFMTQEKYLVYWKGNKVRKVYYETKKFGKNIFYNEVYLDLIQKTAYGICNIKSVSCDTLKGQANKVDFEVEKLSVTPVELLKDVTPEAVILRKEWFDDRDTFLIQFLNKKGQFEYLNLDSFYGLPVKQVISVLKENEERMLTQVVFADLAVEHLEEEDVSLPNAYKIVEN